MTSRSLSPDSPGGTHSCRVSRHVEGKDGNLGDTGTTLAATSFSNLAPAKKRSVDFTAHVEVLAFAIGPGEVRTIEDLERKVRCQCLSGFLSTVLRRSTRETSDKYRDTKKSDESFASVVSDLPPSPSYSTLNVKQGEQKRVSLKEVSDSALSLHLYPQAHLPPPPVPDAFLPEDTLKRRVVARKQANDSQKKAERKERTYRIIKEKVKAKGEDQLSYKVEGASQMFVFSFGFQESSLSSFMNETTAFVKTGAGEESGWRVFPSLSSCLFCRPGETEVALSLDVDLHTKTHNQYEEEKSGEAPVVRTSSLSSNKTTSKDLEKPTEEPEKKQSVKCEKPQRKSVRFLSDDEEEMDVEEEEEEEEEDENEEQKRD